MKTIKMACVTLVALVAATALQAGPVGGPLKGDGTLRPGQSREYNVLLRGGEITTVSVRGFTNADLDIRVIDPLTGQVIAQDLRLDPDAFVSFVPPGRGNYIIRVTNASANLNGDYDISVR